MLASPSIIEFNVSNKLEQSEKEGKVLFDSEKGWARYLEPHDGSDLATAIIEWMKKT